MNGTILCVGKLKEKWQQQGCEEYLKRLSRYGKYEVVAVDDVKDPDRPSEALIRQNMDREGQALLRHIRPTDRVICLCIRAEAPDSVALSKKLTAWSGDGRRNVFVIGGSNGLSEIRVVADGKDETINLQPNPDRWFYEIQQLVPMILSGEKAVFANNRQLALMQTALIESSRKAAGIVYPGDK